MLEVEGRFADRYEIHSATIMQDAYVSYKAWDTRGERWVVLKALHPDYQKKSLENLVRFRRDADSLRDLRHENICSLLDHGEWGGIIYTVYEYLEGERLIEWLRRHRYPKENVFISVRILSQVTAGLLPTHSKGILHRDLKPFNIMIVSGLDGIQRLEIQPGKVKLLDYSVARLIDFSRFLASHSTVDTFSYMPPEQAGLLRQPVDQRADLYSVGILGYELLSGTPPYVGKDPGELLHQHMVGTPVPLRERNPNVPESLSRIIDRLMEKLPEKRYFSAETLLRDLQVVTESLQRGITTVAPLRVAEDPGQRRGPRMPVPMLERSKELGMLKQAFLKAKAGKGRVLLVEGEAGIGKTRLVEEFRKGLIRKGVLFLYGKCDRSSQRIPYQTYCLALENLAEIFRGWPKEKRDAYREKLRGSMRDLGALLTQLVPGLCDLLGTLPSLPDLGPVQGRERFMEAFSRFIGELGSLALPLVFVLDDLQWAEEESLRLLARQRGDLSNEACLIIGLYRREEAGENPLLQKLRHDIDSQAGEGDLLILDPLSPEGVRAFVREALSLSGRGYQMLYREIRHISRGNPFIMHEALQTLAEKQIIRRNGEDGSWTYDAASLRKGLISSNVIELILKRTRQIPEETQKVLAIASAIRGSFSFDMLLPVSGMEEFELLDHLDAGLRFQFIEEVGLGSHTVSYQFIHDRIREAIYNRISDREKRRIHQRIGEFLESRSEREDGQNLFDLAHHFLMGEDSSKAAEYLVKAGDRAFNQSAHREAVYYYEEASTRLVREDLRYGHVHEQLGDLYNILGEYDKALEAFERIRDRQDTSLAKVAWNRKVGTVFHKKGDVSHAIEHLEQALILLGRRPHKRRSTLFLSIFLQTLLQSLSFGGGHPVSRRRGRTTAVISRIVELTRIYRELTYLYLFSDMLKAVEAHVLRFHFAERSGDAALIADAYRAQGIYLAQMRRFKKAETCLKKSLQLYDRLGDSWGIANANNYLGVFHLYQGHLDEAVHYMGKAVYGLEKAEDRWELETAYVHLALLHVATGECRKALDCFERIQAILTEGGDERGKLGALVGLGVAHTLLGDLDKAEASLHQALNICRRSGHPFFWSSYYWSSGFHYMLREDWDGSVRELRSALDVIRRNRLFSFYSVPPFYSLVHALLKKASQVKDKKAKRKLMREARRTLLIGRVLSARFPAYSGQFWVLEGTYWALKGRDRRAGKAYQKGIRILERCRADYYLARGYEEYGAHLARRNDPRAGEYRERAKAFYYEKGLKLDYTRIVRQAREDEHTASNRLPTEETQAIGDEPILTPESRALHTLLEVSGLITETLKLKEVLGRITDLSVQSLGAERGVLFMDEAFVLEDFSPVSSCSIPGFPFRVLTSKNMEQDDSGREPLSVVPRILKEVAETCKPILIADLGREARFVSPAGDQGEDRSDVGSILCVPLTDEGVLVGLLYLDNHRTAQPFSRQDLSFLQTLAYHAVIAIRNARAFEHMQRQRDEIQRLKDRLQEEIVYLKEEIQAEHNFEEIVGRSPAMREIFGFIEKAAPLDQPVLILGETGTGKELVARAIHRLSERRKGPFVKINCAALPSGLLESELFGHEKGAFTGAIRRKIGRFELADGGTLFLDEIGEMSPDLQAKLLRVLQDKEFERVGGTQSIRVDLRVLSATNRNLREEMEKGSFRRDLYYRLNVLPVELPPLRKRKEDIPLLVSYFIDRMNRKLNKEVRGLDQDSQKIIQEYDWPGNVRELENLVERAMVLSTGPSLHLAPYLSPQRFKGETGVDGSGGGIPAIPVAGDYYASVEAYKRWVIQDALRRAGGSKKEAARLLGMAPSYLSRLLKSLRIRED